MLRNLHLKTKLLGVTIGILVITSTMLLVTGLVSLRKSIYEEKQIQTKNFVDIGLTTLQHYHAMELKGLLDREQAQTKAKEAIQAIRFGERGLDYFWINDFYPRMIMHPFRPDLEGKDLSGVKDPDGLTLFVEFVKMCSQEGKGYVPYKWQYYDNTTRIESKLSYVAEFTPWQWIIGTGVYLDDVKTKVYSTATVLLLIFLVMVGLGSAFSFFFSRNIGNVLTRLTKSLGSGAQEVAAASGQISAASQSLAEGASEQAASIEQSSASLEQMSSMTRQNADNAGQADALMKEATQVITKANESMERLNSSMEDISLASHETSKIVKTIDEIAFQTNLLALNAAVEAARAGEAGAGFAVVADEVRNLAMRASKAAQNTANLIEGTVKKVTDGASLSEMTNQAFIRVAESTAEVTCLLDEITAASREQAQGIEEVNKAVVEMDKVTQQNAANAEESASASEQLSAQAEQMKCMVDELLALVGGSGNGQLYPSDLRHDIKAQQKSTSRHKKGVALMMTTEKELVRSG
jgi:methyl-accepting chemotaxis protein